MAAKSTNEKNENVFVPKRIRVSNNNGEATVSTTSHDDLKASLETKNESVEDHLQSSDPNAEQTYGNDLDLGVIAAPHGSKNRFRKTRRTLKTGKAGKKEKKSKGASEFPSASPSASASPSVIPSAIPSALPSSMPSALPSALSSASPSDVPSASASPTTVLPYNADVSKGISCAIRAYYLTCEDDSANVQFCADGINPYGRMDSWDISDVTRLDYAFYSACSGVRNMFLVNDIDCSINWASINPIIEQWNTENVETMYRLFDFCYFYGQEPDLSGWDTANVKQMGYAFGDGDFNRTGIFSWNISNVEYFNFMFAWSDFDQPLGDVWTLPNKTDIYGMFKDADSFNQCMNAWADSNPLGADSAFMYALYCTKYWCTCD